MKTVAILGTGPAGLMAAHACKLQGVPFHLFGIGRKSELGGAQFLHKAVPELHDQDNPDFSIRYRTVGDFRSYQQKVYGVTDTVPFVSFQNVTNNEEVPAWDLGKTYDAMWQDIAGDGSSINEMQVGPLDVIKWAQERTFDLIVSTIPKKALCLSANGMINTAHHFWSQQIRVMPSCIFGDNLRENDILYDGTPNVSWYRTSRINGTGSTEWGAAAPERLPYDTFTLTKPINTTCTCFADDVLFTGRHGAWRKGLLVHNAFVDTWKALEQ